MGRVSHLECRQWPSWWRKPAHEPPQDTSYPPPPMRNFMIHRCTSTNGGSSIVNILQCSITKGQLNLCRSYLTQLWVYMFYSHGWNPEIQHPFYDKTQAPLRNLWSELSDSKVMWFNPGWLMMGFRAIPHDSMGKNIPIRQPGNLWSLHRKKNCAQRQAQKGPAQSPDCSLYRSIVSRCIWRPESQTCTSPGHFERCWEKYWEMIAQKKRPLKHVRQWVDMPT